MGTSEVIYVYQIDYAIRTFTKSECSKTLPSKDAENSHLGVKSCTNMLLRKYLYTDVVLSHIKLYFNGWNQTGRESVWKHWSQLAQNNLHLQILNIIHRIMCARQPHRLPGLELSNFLCYEYQSNEINSGALPPESPDQDQFTKLRLQNGFTGNRT